MISTTNVLLISSKPHEHAQVRAALEAVRGKPYRLEIASSLADGIARLRQGGIQVALLALNLADSTGLTTLLRIQPKATNLPIIVIVDAAEEDLAASAVERGALDHLTVDQMQPHIVHKALRYATEHTHTLLALKASEQRYRELFQNVTAGVFQTTPDGKFMAANPALVRMLGYDSEDELTELDVARDVYMDPLQRKDWIEAMMRGGEVRNAEMVLKRKDGSKIVVLENSRAVRDADGRVLFFEGALTDITASHELSQQLSYDASHDALTGLVNRREFELRLQRALELTQATGATHAMLYLDLDRLKTINDSCGHVAGDELLRQTGQRLSQRVRAGDVVARLGGDEFAVLLHNCAPNDAMQVANTLLQAVSQSQFVWGSQSFSQGVSIGLVAINPHMRRLAQVMNAADTACYAAKDHGRNRIVVYEEDATSISRRDGDVEWVGRAKRALTENRLFLEAQPIVPLAETGDATHYELLVRMRDDSGRTVPPGAFLPAVERSNLSVRYDRWIIMHALQWLASHPPGIDPSSRFFINLSRDSVADIETPAFVRRAIGEAGVDPKRLGFEITECIAIGNLTRTNHLISDLRRAGCTFGLDDFGSGVSSFAYLKALSVEYLKVDGMYIGNISQDRVDYAMVRSIKEIGHVMGRRVVAESVETPAVLEKLREIGVDYAQGFAVGMPRALEEIGKVSVSDLLL
jgi:diguanylate cyclase (GGDEF)-like protein/PAS domain S-box-containing protein